ncbi:hypothetical protein SLE2022_032490 [Rubroshorea leprosula]
MEIANKLVELATRAASNNVVIDVFLVTSFAALCARLVNQQNNIQIPEAEKESLIKANKAMIKTMSDWKQQLFAKAAPVSSLVPLATLKANYGEAPAPHIEDAVKEDAKSPSSEIVV